MQEDFSPVRYIFITGGVVSSLGKGIVAASIGKLLVEQGLRVSLQKLDPYINVDPGTMSPLQHGEVFVTEDGAETDLDLGHYERFTDINTTRISNVTAGAVYQSVIQKERRGAYLGSTVQVIPHITDEIKQRIRLVGESYEVDVIITEIGGTVGDIEALPFIEAVRQFPSDVGRSNCMFIHLTLVPYLESTREIKTKPTQHSTNELRRIGIHPDMIVCRSTDNLDDTIKKKISLFTGLHTSSIITSYDVERLIEVPLVLKEQQVDKQVLEHFNLDYKETELQTFKNLVHIQTTSTVEVAIVGKYVQLGDAYLSIVEALFHAGLMHKCHVEIRWIDSESLTKENTSNVLEEVAGIIIPPGFGSRGIEGKIRAAQFARTHNIPFLGICLGMQIAVCEFARNVALLSGANSTEFDSETSYPVVDILPEQREIIELGASMRRGSDPVKIKPETYLSQIYSYQSLVHERHRHRYEINNRFREQLESHGLVFSGTSPDERLIEAFELPSHPFYLGVQFHPEFKSRPANPSPPFANLVQAMVKYANSIS
jgi:CTP synthase